MLVTSLEQLESAVRFAYGNINARVYLEKFYHLRIQFPVGTKGVHDLRIATFARRLGCTEEVIDILEQYDAVKPLSFRTIERIVTYLNVVSASVPKGGFNLIHFSVLLCVLKVVYPNQYDLARQTKLTFK